MIQQATKKFNADTHTHTLTFEGTEGHLVAAWLKLKTQPAATATIKIFYINDDSGDTEVEIHSQKATSAQEQNYYIMPANLVTLSKDDKIKLTFTNTSAIEGTSGITFRDRF